MLISMWLASQLALLTLLFAFGTTQPQSAGQAFLFAALGVFALVALTAALAHASRISRRRIAPVTPPRRATLSTPFFERACDPGVPGTAQARAPTSPVRASS